jgi:hypothetical protein
MALSGEIHTLDATDAAGTEWRILDTGLIVQFPPGNQRLPIEPITPGLNEIAAFGFNIYASRDSGAGNLYLDTLILLPVDEYFLYWDRDPGIVNTIATGVQIFIQALSDDSHFGFQRSGVAILAHDLYVNPPTVLGEGIPHDPNANEVYVYAVAACAEDQGSTNRLTSTFGLYLNYIPRYKSGRGAL